MSCLYIGGVVPVMLFTELPCMSLVAPQLTVSNHFLGKSTTVTIFPMRIYAFGDSITQGFFDSQGGWTQRLANSYHQKSLQAMLAGEDYYIELHNLGVSGDTAAGVANRIEREIKARQLYEEDETIILAIGMNDAILRDNRPMTEVYEFQKQYDKLLEDALKISSRIVCVGLTAVDETKTDPWRFSSTGKQWKNNRINLFEDTIKQTAQRKNVIFIPLHDQFLTALSDGQNLLADGLHPNDTGHDMVANIVKPVLDGIVKAS